MPEIDTDTFQVIALALSAAALLVSLLVLAAVSKLRKDVGDLAARASAGGSGATSEAPAGAQSYSQAEPPAQEEAPAEATPSQTAPQATRSPRQAEPAGTAAPATTATTPAQETTEIPAASAADIPEEQPFERDGRWWFKRGDELLVYDETSGQWKPAPAGSLASASAKPTAETAYTPVSEATSGSQGDAGGAADAGMWKCPSCGAVNGATAGSCRMCFTARP